MIDSVIKEFVVEWIDEWIDDSGKNNVDDIVVAISKDEINFNNADTSSGQTVWNDGQIRVGVEAVIKELRDDDDRCPKCLHILADEDIITQQDMVTNDPHPMYQTIVTGIHCSSCGYKEDC